MEQDPASISVSGLHFIKTPSGVLRIAQVICCAIGITCTLFTSMYMPGEAMVFYNVSTASAIVFSVLTIFLRITNIYTTFSVTSGIVFEQVLCLAFGGLCISAGAWMGQFGSSRNAKLVVASAAGFVASLAFLLDFFFLCQSKRLIKTQQKEHRNRHHQYHQQ